MFTSRAEYRLRLRADNADQRLTDRGIDIGCVGSARAEIWNDKKQKLDEIRELASRLCATPNELEKKNIKVNKDGSIRSAFALLGFPHISWADLAEVWPELTNIEKPIVEQIEIDALYAGYMGRHDADVAAFRKDEALKLPENLDYSEIGSLSGEVRDKLEKARPATLGAASRISGVTPAAIVALLRYVKAKKHKGDGHGVRAA